MRRIFSNGVSRFACCFLLAATLGSDVTAADSPKPERPATKPLPPPGIEVPAAKRAEMQRELNAFEADLSQAASTLDPRSRALLADVEIYAKAVRVALADGEFFRPVDVDGAFRLLREGRARLDDLKHGQAPWTTAHGLVVRGYVSKLDGSVQPYGLVIPQSYSAQGSDRFRLDFWFHGRDEKLSELKFLLDREKDRGTFTPRDTIVLHPYGRYCNANKFGGEVDVFEALEAVKQHYRVDDDRILVRGFSMGGASTWHLAVHYPTQWAAANPGAGFSETPKFAKVFESMSLAPTWWETKLFHYYDCTDWAGNLWHCPTIAYSGEKDRQKQAADVMAEALKPEGIDLVHVIGPNTQHRYEPHARDEVERRIDSLAERGRDRLPEAVRFTTYTLRYNRCGWITVDGLDRHWEKARIEARPDEDGGISVLVDNVSAFTIAIPPGYAPIRGSLTEPLAIRVHTPRTRNDERPPRTVTAKVRTKSDRSWTASFHRDGERWLLGPQSAGLRKKHGLQGPIDDAFYDPFLFVRPTGKCRNAAVDEWTHREMERAITQWRRQFRGVPRVKDDRDVTPADIQSKNLILWGDSTANSLVAKVVGKLPIQIDERSLTIHGEHYDGAHHVPMLIHPNPLNAQRYIVLNSGLTFRERANLSNSLQIPKLPDWAIIDIRTPPSIDWPGKVVVADFFDEQWQLRPPRAQ